MGVGVRGKNADMSVLNSVRLMMAAQTATNSSQMTSGQRLRQFMLSGSRLG